jgi:hypothetical protein
VSRFSSLAPVLPRSTPSCAVAICSPARNVPLARATVVRDVDGSKQRVEVFEIDASSLADGQLSFELLLDGETYVVPGPVTKRTAVASVAGEHKSVVNINLS